jgi:hypothetical protein
MQYKVLKWYASYVKISYYNSLAHTVHIKHYSAKWALILTTVFNMSMALNCNPKDHLKYWKNQIAK